MNRDDLRGQVPQTTLPRIVSVVQAISRGAVDTNTIARAAGIDTRHVDYALAGAVALGLAARSGREVLLTGRGKMLAKAARDSEEERDLLGAAVRESGPMSRVAPGLLDAREPTRDELSRRFEKAAGLSASTANQRAAMLLKWRRTLLAPQRLLIRGAPRGMWRRIEIRNFRSIEQATVELAPFTIVVGPNGSGKSNFADALVFARDIARDADAAVTKRGGIVGVRRWRPSKPTDVSVEVRAAGRRRLLEETYSRHFFKLHSLKAPGWEFSEEQIEVVQDGERKAWLQRKDDRITGAPRVSDRPTHTSSAMVLARQMKAFVKTNPLRNVRFYRLNPDEMRQIQLAGEETRLSENGANIAAAIRAIEAAGQLERIVEPMAKVIPGLERMSVEPANRYLVLKFYQRQGNDLAEFTGSEMSEGALRALGIIVAAHQMAADELLIVEEPEVAIHVGAAALMFDVLKEASRRGSVLVTTHSADLLDRAGNDSEGDEEILVCEYIDGKTRIGRLAESQRKLVREGLFSLAEIMRAEPLRIDSDPPTASRRKRGR